MLKENGWNLIELLFVLFVIGAIITLGYPIYNQQLIKTRRSEAHRLLLEAATAQEEWFSRHFSYATTLHELKFKKTSTRYYQLQLNHQYCRLEKTINCYELSAQPKTHSVQKKDQDCQKIIIDHLGQRTPRECWE